MSENSKIEWTDHTFNPWIGCTKVGPGCDHCYAENLMDKRMGVAVWGPGNQRVRTKAANWRKPLAWNAIAEAGFWAQCTGCGLRGDSRTWEQDIRVRNPTARTCCPDRKLVPVRPRVFCASLADVFDNAVDPQWRADLFELIERTPNLDWLLLTKRIGNVVPMSMNANWPMPMPRNIWLGATIVNREEMLRDGPKLKQVPAHVHFWSCEPMLGDLGDIPSELMPHWVIVGGESGRDARPMHPDWARSLRDQCQVAEVPFLFKQWGEHMPKSNHMGLSDREINPNMMIRIGKKAAGRLLDGDTWTQFPA